MKADDIRPEKIHTEYFKLFTADLKKWFNSAAEFIRTNNCVNCSSTNIVKILSGNYEFYRCKCNTLFLNPRPDYNLLFDYYRNAESIKYFVSNIRDKTEKLRIKTIFIPRFLLLKRLLGSDFIKINSLLDAGCGSGAFLKVARNKSGIQTIYGNEIVPESVQKVLKSEFKVFDLPLEIVKTNLKFDVITAFEVLAHTPAPLNFLKKCHTLLNEKGYLFLTTPNFNSLEYKLFYKQMKLEDNPTQMNFFSFDTIDIIFKRAGFEIIKKLTPGELDIDIIYNKWKKKKKNVKDKFLNRLFEKEDADMLREFQKFIKENNMSSHMAILAKKK